jgi:adenylate cyclase
VVVGASAPSLQDLHPTPTSGTELMAGPELQANAIATVLHGLPLRDVGPAAAIAIVLVAAAVAPLASVWLSWVGILVGAFAGAVVLGAGAVAAFAGGWVAPLAAPGLALGLGTLGALGIRVAAEARERQRVRETFGRFVPEPVVSELLSGDAGPRLPPARRDATVLFCDLRGFSAFAERAPVEHVLELLDRYLTEMSEAVLAHGGTVVSYAGDGLMAVFGSPVPRDDHAIAAYAAAREMLDSRLPRLNAWLAESGEPAFALGVGLNSGPVMTGTVGSDRRLEYAAVGDTTNVAARLEAMTKATGGGLLLSEVTRRGLGEAAAAELEPYGDVVLRGRTEPLGVFKGGDLTRAHGS